MKGRAIPVDQPIIWEQPAPSIEHVERFRLRRNGSVPGDSLTGQRIGNCAPTAAGEIVVCATDPEANRLQEMPDMAEGPPKAEMQISENATVGLSISGEQMPNGVTSNRVMIGTKIKF